MVICEPRAVDEINVRNGSLESLDEIACVKLRELVRKKGVSLAWPVT